MKRITPYQLEILSCLLDIEKATGRLTDLDQLLEKLTWMPSKESLQFTIRAMIQKEFILKMPHETRRNRNRVCFSVLKAGRAIFDPREPLPAIDSFAESLIPGVLDLSETVES